ncbi:FtsK/SpoIIIE domain-containing protein [Gordonia sp. 4N]|uniref:FtsK/SpoIIIE domain-containing protein n=3 Tax=unclassified Gordonia (in: high G+C Gram-positive bacteria) TaxID=2657482 RepID=UPI002249648D|nr:FtsK/SpoIIIE domain-containing protein [Gordonia sp. 4N]MCX2755316.1 FtsK/SpoIIIE domain-containing protein [Gordonia sp. 4N]
MAIDYTHRGRRGTGDTPPDNRTAPTATPGQSAVDEPVVPTTGRINYSRPDRQHRTSAPETPGPSTSTTDSAATADSPASVPISYERPRRTPSRSVEKVETPSPPTALRAAGPTRSPSSPSVGSARPGHIPDRIRSRAESTVSSAERSTLAESSEAVEHHVPTMRAHVDHYLRRVGDELSRVVADLPDISAIVMKLSATHDRLQSLMKDRFPDQFGSLYHSAGGAMPPPEVWLSATDALITDLTTRRIPMTAGGRAKDWERFSAQYKGLACHFQPILDDLHKRAFNDAVTIVNAASGRKHEILACDALQVFPGTDILAADLPSVLSGLRPGLGQLYVSLGGALAALEVDLTLVAGDGKSRQAMSVETTAASLPAILDLGRAGGFRTTEPLMAERVILQLLASLPADQLTIRVFDPLKLGDSAAFLYGLDEVMDRVIGDKVKTTDREIDELLQETEEHITRVTQKYLQGDHATLTDYNIAAKMVTEPYRILLLYGFPAGFSRQNHLDHDRLERLAKIVDGGSRAGVFTIVVSDDIMGIGPTTPAPGEGNARSYIDSLPCFGNGLLLDPQAQSYLLGTSPTDTRTRLSIMTNNCGLGFQSRATFANLTGSELEVRWAPLLVRAEEQDKRRAMLVERVTSNFQASTGTVIRPGWVSSLAGDPLTAHPYEPSTWWRKSTATGANASIGQLGATKVAQIRLHSGDGGVGALIGGRPGSGKSVLMHAMIMSLVTEYSPSDLELYLIDFKEGVEFKRYADHALPHAKAVAIDAEREFGIAVLEGMVAEIERRGALFKAFASNITKLDDYRKQSGSEALARQITIIDEFQKLFERDDKIAQQASHLIERILREGRAFGLHIVLASQTIQGMQGLDRHVLSLIPTRVALRMSAGDSELILGEGNPEARELSRAGEGIINVKQGHPDANERFQTTLWHDRSDHGEIGTDAEDVLTVIRAKADHLGFSGAPRVYAGDDSAELTADIVSEGRIPVGLPVSLAPALSYDMRREGGANLLVVNESYGPLLAALVALARTGAKIRLVDFLVGDEEWTSTRAVLADSSTISIGGRRSLEDVIDETATVVEGRVEYEDYNNPAEYVVLFGVHRARDLDPDNDYDDASTNARLTRILRDGPEVGVHVLAWTDRGGILNRRISPQALREFGLRLVGPSSPEDSQLLVDSDAAATLKRNQAVFDDHDHGVTARVLAYGPPSPDTLIELL